MQLNVIVLKFLAFSKVSNDRNQPQRVIYCSMDVARLYRVTDSEQLEPIRAACQGLRLAGDQRIIVHCAQID